ncbi:MAG: uridine kinase [Pseudomonadota bacterium]|nr:uridine kinase [Gammaproteobacteria bacterium]MBU1559095.1 uridine kinase [Gammaproteobacteria bacterium]MBU1628610.1 uridine kinase [Gammaproteobacteria bacterium]MBU1926492.1 uridine kinase [Gammaproteobacteria bacterium]MBU2546315.1 uridine kinase [Gammaproteobacteria bacterium]
MNNKTIIIGIAGASGSGKSLLSNTIVNEMGSKKVEVISEDSYYKDLGDMPFEERAKINYDHPNSVDHELLLNHLTALKAQENIKVPIYDFAMHSRKEETRKIGGHTIIILEGILLFVDQHLREMMDIRIFMDTPSDICLMRRIRRDIEERGRSIDSILTQYEQTVRPMYLQFIEPSKRYADIIVPRGGFNRIAIEVIKAKMRENLGD